MPQSCDGSPPAPWMFGVSGGGFETDIVFDGGERVATRQLSTSVSVGRSLGESAGLTVTASWVPGGHVEDRAVKSGAALSAGAHLLAVYEGERRPFVALTATGGVARVRARADDARVRDWTAADLRMGAMSGKSFGRVVPYVAARAFGGPVRWHREGEPVAGTDANHVTGGAGLTLRLPGRLDVTAEVMPLGERSVSAGVSAHF